MEIPPQDAVKNIPFIILGIWPVNLLTLWAQGHTWSWDVTPEAVIGLWEWGLLVSLSLVILTELGVDMFIALAKYRRLKEQAQQARERAREEGRKEGHREGRKEGRKEGRREADDMLMVLSAAARTNPDLLPSLLQEYQEKYQNGSTGQ